MLPSETKANAFDERYRPCFAFRGKTAETILLQTMQFSLSLGPAPLSLQQLQHS